MLSRERQVARSATRIYKAKAAGQDVMLEAAVKEMIDLGGIFIKFAQMLMLSQAFFKSIPADLRRQVFDKVKVQEKTAFEHYLNYQDRRDLATDIEVMTDRPVAGGSFAAVFEGRLKSGEAVVIKFLRPELKATLRRDLRLLGLLARPMGLLNEELKLAIQGAIKAFRQSTLAETDYIGELQNAKTLEAAFAGDPSVVIPKTYRHLSNGHRLVQAKLEGVWLSEILEAGLKGEAASSLVRSKTGSDIEKQLYGLGVASLHGSLSGKTVHGDPHPGNVVLMRDNKVGLIDFGILASPFSNRLALLEYIKVQIETMKGNVDVTKTMLSVLRFHANYLYRAITKAAEIYKRPLLEELDKLLKLEVMGGQPIADRHDLENGDYGSALSSNINENNRFGLVPKLDTPLSQKAFTGLWRLNQELAFDGVTRRVFEDAVARIEAEGIAADWREEPMSADQALRIVAEWLSLISEKDPRLFARLRMLFAAKG